MYNLGLIEDNIFLMKNVVDYLSNFCRHRIIFTCASSEEFEKNVNRHKFKEIPDLILLDIKLPGRSGIDTIDLIRNQFPAVKILMLSGFAEKNYILESLKKGASGFMFKTSKLSQINDAIVDTITIGAFISPIAALPLIDHLSISSDTHIGITQKLTKREHELMQLVKEGLSYKEMADKMFLSVHTINHHLKSIYQKMGVSSKSELLSKFI